MKRTLSSLLLLGAASACAAEVPATETSSAEIGTAGHLDPNFAVDGSLRVEFNDTPYPAHDTIRTIVGLPGGRLLAAGVRSTSEYGGNELAVARFGYNGAPDLAFGTQGRVTIKVAGSSYPDFLETMLASGLPDGSVLVAAQQRTYSATEGGIIVLKLDPNGVLDPTFGTAGMFRTNLGATNLAAGLHGLVVQPDGRFVIVGYPQSAFPGSGNVRVVRFLGNGAPDPTFQAAVPTENVWNVATAALPDGGLVLALPSRLIKLTRDGAADPTFQSATLPDGDYISSVAAVPNNGGFVVAGTSRTTDPNRNDLMVARFTATGALAPAGVQRTTREESPSVTMVATTSWNGDAYVVGGLTKWTRTGLVDRSYFIERVRSDGRPDTSWGERGFLTQPISGELVDGPAAAFVTGSRVLVAATQGSQADRDGIVRSYAP